MDLSNLADKQHGRDARDASRTLRNVQCNAMRQWQMALLTFGSRQVPSVIYVPMGVGTCIAGTVHWVLCCQHARSVC